MTFSGRIGYSPDIKAAQLDIKIDAKLKSKNLNLRTKIADATIVTPLLLQADDKAIAAKDQMPGVIPMSASADILFVVNQSVVRPTELSQDDIKALWNFIDEAESDIMDGKKVVGKKNNYDIKGVSISAYASPDGIESKNATLASDRANSTAKAIMAGFKKYKMSAGTQESFYNKTSTPEDWEGFKQLMNESNITDKDMILRILSTNSDIETREQEMKNISKAYTEISDQIFPKLRRAKITINGERKPRTDEMIAKMSASAPDSLNLEELMRAGSLSTDLNIKASIYSMVISKFPEDWRGPNNLGHVYLMQNKVSDAKSQFEKADKLSANNTIIKNNLGVVARIMGDRDAAEAFYKSANGAGPEVNTNLANIYVSKGDYSSAVSNYGSVKSFNAALAQLLNGNKDEALTILEASKDAGTAMGLYLKAVIAARMGNTSVMSESLKAAISKDGSLKQMAKEDMEFLKYTNELSSILK